MNTKPTIILGYALLTKFFPFVNFRNPIMIKILFYLLYIMFLYDQYHPYSCGGDFKNVTTSLPKQK